MTIFLVIVHVLVCLILILVILLQAGRGQGLSGPTFASGNVQSLLGTRAGDFLTKATSIAAVCFLFTCIGLNFIETQKSKSLLDAGRRRPQVDMATLKKVLEKVKQEKAVAAKNSVAQTPQGSSTDKTSSLPGENPGSQTGEKARQSSSRTPDANAAKH